jgi:hypothetical protein
MPGLVLRGLARFFGVGFLLVAMTQPVNAQATRAIIAIAAATTKR